MPPAAQHLARHWETIASGGRAFGRGIVFILRLLIGASPRLAAALAALILLQAALPVLNIRLTQSIVNALAGGAAAAGVVVPLVAYVALHVVTAALSPALRTVEGLANERIMGHIQVLVLSRVNAFSDLAHFEDSRLYDEVQTLGARAQHLPRHLLRQSADVAEALLAGTGLCLMLAALHPLIPLVLLAVTLPGMVIHPQSSTLHWGNHAETAELERRQQYWLGLGTSAGAARDVQLFGISGWIRDQFAQALEGMDAQRWRLRKRILWRALAMLVLRFVGTAGVFLYLVAHGLAGAVRPGDFVLFLGSLLTLDGYLRLLPFQISHMIDATGLSDRFLAFLQPEASEGVALSVLPAEALRAGLEVAHLAFQYPGRAESVLQDVSFRIRSGETVALVGRNGAGKTTLVKLLTGLYRPAAGSIRVDGWDLARCEPNSVRASIAVAFQDHCRYFLTVGENIGLGRIDHMADAERIARAAREGGAEPLIQRLEDGYATRLGREFGGTQLSGGEWQKLALSRAFMRDADLLILDEPTAALDVRAEAEIYQRFQTLLGGRAGLLISHRFSTVRMAHRILVLDEGRIVEEGSHEALMAQDGMYAAMFRTQAAAFQAGAEEEA